MYDEIKEEVTSVKQDVVSVKVTLDSLNEGVVTLSKPKDL